MPTAILATPTDAMELVIQTATGKEISGYWLNGQYWEALDGPDAPLSLLDPALNWVKK